MMIVFTIIYAAAVTWFLNTFFKGLEGIEKEINSYSSESNRKSDKK